MSRSIQSVLLSILLIFVLLGGQGWATEGCPECVDPSSITCKPWGQGQARFQWASDESLTSDITLTAGPCGQPGETGTAYIFSFIDAHGLNCNSDTDIDPCGGDEDSYGAFAIIKVSGNQKAFQHIFPDGLVFAGNKIIGGNPPQWASTTVDKTGCNYELAVASPPEFKIRLNATIAQCQSEFDNSRFGINVTFYQKRGEEPDSYSILARAKGSITVKANKKTDCDPINFKPDLRDGSNVAWIEEVEWDYAEDGDDEWMILYKLEDYDDSCSPEEGWVGPEYIPGTTNYLVPSGRTYYRVKYPAYKKDVNGTPDYAGMDGWSYDPTNKDIILSLGGLGKVYYHCGRKSGNRYMVNSIEHCDVDVDPGEGDTKWKLLYEGNDKLKYIYNGISVGDPNNPETGTKYYSFDWDDDDPNIADVMYYRREDTQSSWTQDREWNLKFDSQGRAVKYDASCSSGCGGASGEFWNVEYHPDFEDVIVKRFDAQGEVVIENTVGQITYGQYEPAYWIWITNHSFEFNDVTAGSCESLDPTGWERTDGDLADVMVCDPNTSVPDGQQVLRLAGDVTLEQQTYDVIWEDTKYLFEASVRSVPGEGTGVATISLYSTEESVYDPLIEISFEEGVDANDGEWTEIGDVWDSADYSGTETDARFIIVITGDMVEVDGILLSASAFVGNETKPVITKQEVYDETLQQLVTAGEWTYDEDNLTVLEKKYVDGSYQMVTKYEYADKAFTRLKKKIECETLNDDPDNPTGNTYTTIYDPNDAIGLYITNYPNGKRADVEFYDDNGLLIRSYVLDTVSDVNTLMQEYEYTNLGWSEEPRWEVEKQTSPRGGITEYTYKRFGSSPYQTADFLLESRKEPQTTAGQQETWYDYDGAQRVIKEEKKDTDGNWVETRYNYDPDTGYLNSVVLDHYGIHAQTAYMRNDFGQVIRQFNPDGVATGKSYGLGGELLSEFVISASSDPNDSDSQLTLISQTQYEYNSDGQLEKVKRAKDTDEFTYDNPDDWIVTKYEYDPQGRKSKVIEDYDESAQRFNLETIYEYDRQGRLEKTTYPTGRWVEITRDGRGLIRLESTGYGQTDVYQTAYDYDANGNLIEQVNPDETVLVYEYDNYDQLEKTYKYSTSGPYTFKEYDEAGAIVLEQAIDPNGIILQDVRKEYNVLGSLFLERFVAVPNYPDDAEDVISTYEYDIAGNLRKIIQKGIGSDDPNGTIEADDAVTEYFYNSLNRKYKTIDSEGIISDYFYSDAGQLLMAVDPNIPDPNQIFVTTNTYDDAGRLEEVVNPEGHYTINSYNSLNQLARQMVWDCNSTADDLNDDVAVRQVRYEYDNLGNRTRQAVMEDPASTSAIDTTVDMVMDSVYDTSTGLLVETKTYYGSSPTTAVTTYHYDEIDRNWKTVGPEGNEIRKHYDTTNKFQVVKQERFEKDPAESNDYTVTVFYDYDIYGNLYRKTLDEDGEGSKDSTDPSTFYYYDALDRPEKQVGPDSVVTYREYDAFGNVSKTIEDYDPSSQDALNRTTEYLFDRLNRQSHIIAYDPNDTTEHVASQTTSYEYNKRGQVEKIIYPDDSFVQYNYNDLRQVDEEIRRDGTSIYFWYDLLGHVTAESDDDDIEYGSPTFVTEYDYNAAGNLVLSYKEEDEVAVAESTFVYNGFGLPESESTTLYDLDPKSTTYTYDGSGNVLTQTHNGETLTHTYDGLGRIETIDRGDDNIVEYAYIGSGTKAIDYPEADVTQSFGYDKLGRITRCSSTDPNSDVMLNLIYTYDENSNRDSVEYNHLTTPVWDIYSYDTLQRLIEAEYGSLTGIARLDDYVGDIQFAAGVASKWLVLDKPFMELAELEVRDIRRQQKQVHQALVEAGLDTVVRQYNNDEMPLVSLVEFGEEDTGGGKDKSTYEVVRNDTGEVIAIIVTNKAGRITLFTLYPAVGGTVVVSIGYDNKGNETSKILTSYDDDGNVVETVDLLATEQSKATTDYTDLADQSFAPDGGLGGGMEMMSSPVGPWTTAEEFAYDHLGNRYQHIDKQGYTSTYTHDAVNQYTEKVLALPLVGNQTSTYSHDDNGNLSVDATGYTYAYDHRNRLTEITNVAEYGYDALGRRVKKYDDNKDLTTYFYYDPFGRVIAEYEELDSETAKLARSFVYGNGIDEVLAMFLPERDYDPDDVTTLMDFCDTWLADSGDGNYNSDFDYDDSGVVDFNDFAVLADDSWSLPQVNETRFYYLKDALGSVIGIVGGKFQREEDREFYLYDVYGTPSETSDCGNPYLFTGRRFDPESGLYYFRFRTYDPHTGRFLQTDPIGYADSMNLYEYVTGNPTNWVDPWGLKKYDLLHGYDNIKGFWENTNDQQRKGYFGKIQKEVGHLIDTTAKKYCIPKLLLAGLIANELMDISSFEYKTEHSMFYDFLFAYKQSYGPGQVKVGTAIKYKLFGDDFEYYNVRYEYQTKPFRRYQVKSPDNEGISRKLKDVETSIDVTGKLVKMYLGDLCKKAKIGQLSSSFIEHVAINTDPSGETKIGECSIQDFCILDKKCKKVDCKEIVNMNVPECLLRSIAAMHEASTGITGHKYFNEKNQSKSAKRALQMAAGASGVSRYWEIFK